MHAENNRAQAMAGVAAGYFTSGLATAVTGSGVRRGATRRRREAEVGTWGLIKCPPIRSARLRAVKNLRVIRRNDKKAAEGGIPRGGQREAISSTATGVAS